MFKMYTHEEMKKDIEETPGVNVEIQTGGVYSKRTYTKLFSEVTKESEIDFTNLNSEQNELLVGQILDNYLNLYALPATLDKPFDPEWFCAFYGSTEVDFDKIEKLFLIDTILDEPDIESEKNKEKFLKKLEQVLEQHYNTLFLIYENGELQLFKKGNPLKTH